jgi:hypothetical protein
MKKFDRRILKNINWHPDKVKIDEFAKSRIHQVFGVSCFVFSRTYMMLQQFVIFLNTKHQILNTLVKDCFSDFLRDHQD